ENTIASEDSGYTFYIGGISHFFSQDPVGTESDDKLIYGSYEDSVIVNGNTFTKTKVFKFTENYIQDYPQKIYYSSNIGIIKKEMYDGTIWELKKYSVLQ
ncbi:MAG: hypothetical protein JKX95_03225, partial [Bacteroidia bacterium]|nr:hypothetical protein [Bacteroidia bacterium]